MSARLVSSTGVTARYSGTGATLSFPDLAISRGEHTLLLGPSGSGKSTFLNLLTGLHVPTSGTIIIDDTNLATLTNAERDRFRGRRTGLVMQRLHLIGALTIAQNLQLARSLVGNSVDTNHTLQLLDALGIADKRDQYPRQLSQGEAQRAAIARALVNDPALIVADEPTSALDDTNCAAAVALLKAQAERCSATLLIATHDARLSPHFQHIVRLGV